MQTITLKLLNEKAMNLLLDLEKLHLIKLIKKEEKQTNKESLAGKLSKETADSLRNYIKESREEWE